MICISSVPDDMAHMHTLLLLAMTYNNIQCATSLSRLQLLISCDVCSIAVGIQRDFRRHARAIQCGGEIDLCWRFSPVCNWSWQGKFALLNCTYGLENSSQEMACILVQLNFQCCDMALLHDLLLVCRSHHHV